MFGAWQEITCGARSVAMAVAAAGVVIRCTFLPLSGDRSAEVRSTRRARVDVMVGGCWWVSVLLRSSWRTPIITRIVAMTMTANPAATANRIASTAGTVSSLHEVDVRRCTGADTGKPGGRGVR